MMKVHTVNIMTLLAALSFSPSSAKPLLLESEGLKLYGHHDMANWTESSVGSLRFQVECVVCKAMAKEAQTTFMTTESREELEKVLTDICIGLHIEDRRVCRGIVNMFQGEVFTVFDRLVLSPDEICGTLLGPSCAHVYWPFSPWNVTLPDTPKPPVRPHVLPEPGSPTLRVLHLTDIHLDEMYEAGASADCHEPLCCRSNDGKPGPDQTGAGRYGDYRNCDTPVWTLEGLFSHLAKQQFDYIIMTGDLPAHNIWNQTHQAQTDILHHLSAMINKYFPDKPVFPAVGNHESSPVNSFPPRDITGAQSVGWLYDALADSWRTWLTPDALNTVRKAAYFTISPFPGFRIVSLNMNACNRFNWWLYLNATDPDNQLSWLIDVLQTAENNKEKVHIIGHIPPGISDCVKYWSLNYYRIVDRYESTITGQFFGHTHFDHFEVFYDEATLKRPTNVAYISPSVTTFSNLNMGYRIFTIDGNYSSSSWEVLDYETYILNMTAANAASSPPDWQLEYCAKAAYGMKSLFPKDWDDLISRMEKDDDLLQMAYRFYYKLNVDKPCDASCAEELICGMKSARSYSQSVFCPDVPVSAVPRASPALC